jgi:Tfp pilus assembly protein PilO
VLVFGLLGAVLLGALWYFFLVRPINERKADAEQQLETAQNDELLLRTQLSRLRKIQENELEYKTAIGQIQTSIPPAPQMDQLIDDLSALADDNGIEWTSGSYSVPTLIEGTDVYEIRVSLQVSGQFFEVLGYLYGIAELDRLVRIDSLSLAVASDDAGFVVENVTIDAVAFTTSAVAIPEIDLSELLAPEEATGGEGTTDGGDDGTTDGGDGGTGDAATTTTTEGTDDGGASTTTTEGSGG